MRAKQRKRVMTDAQWYTSVSGGQRREHWFFPFAMILLGILLVMTSVLIWIT